LLPASDLEELLLVFEGELDQRIAAVDVELGADVQAVALDRPHADEQLVGDLAALMVGGEARNAALGRRQVVEGRPVGRRSSGGGCGSQKVASGWLM
jgi:hypothetical protein